MKEHDGTSGVMRSALAWLLAASAALGGCAFLGPRGPQPVEPAVEPSSQYLARGGPATALDTGTPQGQGNAGLMETVARLREESARLEKALEEQAREAGVLRAKLTGLKEEAELERAARLAAEADRDLARAELLERDSRLLDLALRKTRLEQDLLLRQIQELEAKLAATGSGAGR